MNRKKIIILIVICVLVLFCVLGTLINAEIIHIRFPFLESNNRIIVDHEFTEREQFLAELLKDVIIKNVMIQDCEVAVMLDEPHLVVVSITLESDVTFQDFDSQAVQTIIIDTMRNENVNISDENITLSIGLSE